MTDKFRVGLIINDIFVNKQIYDLIKLSQKSTLYEITHLILEKNNKSNQINSYGEKILKTGFKKFINNLCFIILFKVELFLAKKKYSQFKDFFSLFNISNFKIEILSVNPISSGNNSHYEYSQEDIEKIKSLRLNLLIKSSSGSIKGKVFNTTKNGIISFDYTNNNIKKFNSAGFWEVFNKEKKTGFSILRLTDKLHEEIVLFKGYFPTSIFYSLNLLSLYKKSNPFLHKIIEKLIKEPKSIDANQKKIISNQINKIPNIYSQVFYIFLLIKNILKKIITKKYKWSVAYKFVKDWKDTSKLSELIKIPNPPNRFLADPFIWQKNGIHYCFVEDFHYSKNKGCISVFKITRDNYEEVEVVLEENFHLSYPFLFNYKNDLYMCPETHEAEEIRLYKCIEFPNKWEYLKTIMLNVSAVDTNIFEKNGRWWLITNICSGDLKDHSSELHIFSSDNPISTEWKPNKQNPVIFDPLIGRNGGLIIDNEEVYRVRQKQGFNLYGEALEVAKIIKLSDEEYKEEKIFKVEPKFFSGINGTHTYNYKNGLLTIDYLK